MKVEIELDINKKTVDTKEHFPITIRPRDPNLPYDNSEVVPSIALSQQTKNETFEGHRLQSRGASRDRRGRRLRPTRT